MTFDATWLFRAVTLTGLAFASWFVRFLFARLFRRLEGHNNEVRERLGGMESKFTNRIEKQDLMLAELISGQNDQRQSLAELRTTLIGINGDNGLNGTVKQLAARILDVEDAQRKPVRRHRRSA
jgi:hypothetical protein